MTRPRSFEELMPGVEFIAMPTADELAGMEESTVPDINDLGLLMFELERLLDSLPDESPDEETDELMIAAQRILSEAVAALAAAIAGGDGEAESA